MTLEKFVDTGAALPLDEKQRRALGIVSEVVKKRVLAREIRSYGEFRADETVQKVVSAWIGGRIERMYADFTGVRVEKGLHLFDIYSPELYSAQEELLLAIQAIEESPEEGPLRKSRIRMRQLAMDKLALLGLSPDQIDQIERERQPRLTLRIDSPSTGIVLEKMGHSGMYVQKGQPIYRIADLSSLWLILEIHESDLSWIALGQDVEIRTDALNRAPRTGRVGFIEPVLNRKTRTARVRIDVPNEDGALRIGMFASAIVFAALTHEGDLAMPRLEGSYACPMHPLQRSSLSGEMCPVCGMDLAASPPVPGDVPQAVLAIPREAVLSTGTRHLVYMETLFGDFTSEGGVREFIPGNASYSAFEVRLGPLAYEWEVHENGHRLRRGAFYPLLSGSAASPAAGDMRLIPNISRVVLNGQFLIDSQMELTGKPSLVGSRDGSAADPHAGHR
jgi:Cu(I)/Ag(I) efflux system membrane fusion protein